MVEQDSIQLIFAKNRAEEIGYDVWQHFVIPPFYDKLQLDVARKPNIIIGGRGCGKTMLLRYLSHNTMFSPARPEIPASAFKNIGLYWRSDTQFASAMNKRERPDDTWQSAFQHLTALVLGIELLESLDSIAASNIGIEEKDQLGRCNFERLKAFSPDLPPSAKELKARLESKLWEFEAWVNDVRKKPEPSFLPGKTFVLALVNEIRSQIGLLSDATYHVYIDEYENLCTYQQEIINTWLKHSEAPLIFNLAMKRYSFQTKRTVGIEALSDIHDYRTHDLEAYFLEDRFELFAAEILFLLFENAGIGNSPVTAQALRDPHKLIERRSPHYIKQVMGAAERLLPDVSADDLAANVFTDEALKQKLLGKIRSGLGQRHSALDANHFLRERFPTASIVVPALLHRKSESPEEIFRQLQLLEKGEDNRFTGKTNWVHNNFVGCLLQLYEPHSRACPFYAGFRTFCHLSRGNPRHFLELCHKSIKRSAAEIGFSGSTVSVSDQAEAARQASAAFLGEIKSFGRHGNQLHSFVLKLGSLFALAHQRPSLSESEQSHFSIISGAELGIDDQEFLKEAVKWSVLFEEKGTKKKEQYEPETVDYILNPIYAPYFHISYRKKRKLELSTGDTICLIRGSYEEVTALLRRYSNTWAVEPEEVSPTLFSHLGRERIN